MHPRTSSSLRLQFFNRHDSQQGYLLSSFSSGDRLPSPNIQAEKITHPFQLMAAWFVMLIMLVTLLLTAAAKLQRPWWAPCFLIISAVMLSLVVMGAVFLMLTRFRPHLQDAKEYANWLKDERRFANRGVERLAIRELPNAVRDSSTSITWSEQQAQITTRISDPTEPVELIEVSRLQKAREVVESLQSLGFPATIYQSGIAEEDERRWSFRDHESIWVGSKIGAPDAILTIKTVIRIWPHLCYLHLSSDSAGPDYIHGQMFFGGSSNTAREYGLERWSRDEINSLPDSPTQEVWHLLVRRKYGSKSD